jgi:adenylyl-sulfate kinase
MAGPEVRPADALTLELARDAAADTQPISHDINWEPGQVAAAQRKNLLGQEPVTVWLTGLSGSGKSTLAQALEARLVALGRACYRLDGDNLRHGLNRDLGFSPEDRRENIRRAAEVARLMNDAGLIVVTAFISPYRDDRAKARRIIGEERFVEVYLSTDLATCEKRDAKGLYAKARRGEIPEFTGINAPYETPTAPELVLDTAALTIDAAAGRLLDEARRRAAPRARSA